MKKGLLFTLLSLFFSWTISAQTNPIKGIVISATDNEPLIGVSVLVKGTTNGTMTDIDGAFSLNAQPSDALLINYLGFKTQEIPVGDRVNFHITLQEDDQLLDEVVVVGYGVQKKSVVSASISRVSSEDLELVTPTRVEDVLKGKVAGVTILQNSGQPGAESAVRIRGIGTVNKSDPLYIVDGMAIDGNIGFLNPTDIESVEILKDAASAAIYGTRGANGVILVTTKSGKAGKANINYDFSYGWQNPWKKRSMLNAREYMIIQNEIAINDNSSVPYTKEQIESIGKGTDWQDKTFNYDAPVQSHQVNVNGGNEKYTYYLAFGYFNQEGIVGGNYGKSNYERYNIRVNNTINIYEEKSRNFLNKIKVGVNANYTRTENSDIEANSEYGSILGSAIVFDPTVPVYATNPEKVLEEHPNAVKDKNGKVLSLPPAGFQEIVNPVGLLNRPDQTNRHEDVIVSSFWGEMDIFEGLKFRSSYGVDISFWGSDGYTFPYYLGSMTYVQDPEYVDKDEIARRPQVRSALNRRFTWQAENYLTYSKTIGLHDFSVMAGQSAFKTTRKYLEGNRAFPQTYDPDKAWLDNTDHRYKDGEIWIQGGIANLDGTEANFHSLASYFGRVNYNYDERYILSASIRRDGSSRFGSNNKWATFPAVSLAWNILNEPYITSPDWFNVAKVRFSWGRNGNENIDDLRYASFDDRGGSSQNYYFGGGYQVNGDVTGGNLETGTTPGALSNPSLRWEESDQIDIGIDLRFLNNALTFSTDYYKKKTVDMLMRVPLSNYVGQNSPWGNIGDMENWGIEFELGWKQKVKDFTYYVSANASYLKNKLTRYGSATGIEPNIEVGKSEGEIMRGSNGEPYPYFYGRKTDGIFQNWDEINSYTWTNPETGEVNLLQPDAVPGDVRFRDLNNDGKVNDDDKTKIGKPTPDWTFGFTIGAEWKGFDANFFFQGTAGNDIFEFNRSGLSAFNRPQWMLDRWHGEGTSNKIPRMASSSDKNLNWASSDLYIKDGSYLRLKSAQFGYTLPMNLTRKVSVQKLRFFVAGENLLTFTDYEGFDVEIGERGIDKGVYPQSRTISVGANITF